jgi:DNA repair ATPase RecN
MLEVLLDCLTRVESQLNDLYIEMNRLSYKANKELLNMDEKEYLSEINKQLKTLETTKRKYLEDIQSLKTIKIINQMKSNFISQTQLSSSSISSDSLSWSSTPSD